jgi:putative ABC transport system permease protein
VRAFRLNLSATALPPALVASVRRLPGVLAVDTYRGARIVHGGRPAFVAGVDFAVQREFGRLALARGETRDALGWARARGAAIVSESFAHHHRLDVGDTVALATAVGVARLRVAGVFYDYSTDAGVVLLDRALYARLWRDDRTESLALYLDRAADAGEVRRRLLELAGPDLLLTVTPNQTLRRRVLEVFDQTFQITWALQTIAVVVAVLGVTGTLTALILQRRREVGILRATGATRAQVMRIVFVESGLLGLLGAVLGCVAGWVLALILVHVINKQSFGWTIRMSIDPLVFAWAIGVLTLAATLAGLGPARVAASRRAAEAVRAE